MFYFYLKISVIFSFFFLKKYTSKLIEIIEDTTYPVNTPSGTPP